jgi:hypothetical protein
MEGAAQVDVRNIDMPVLMRLQRLLEQLTSKYGIFSVSLLRRLPVVKPLFPDRQVFIPLSVPKRCSISPCRG